MRLALCIFTVMAFLLPAPEADACSCARSGVEIWPKKQTSAPTNAHVFVRFPGAKQEKLIVRLAGSRDTDGIPATRIDVVAMDVRFVELAPRVKLPHGAKLEVVAGSGNSARVVSSFTVGTKAETSTPATPQVKKVTFSNEEAVCCNCSSGQPYVVIELNGRGDEETRSLFGIWNANAAGKVDFEREPDAYVLSWYGRLTLGDSSSCSANNFSIPTTGKIVVGIREVSQTGTQSKGKIVKVKAHGKKKPSIFQK